MKADGEASTKKHGSGRPGRMTKLGGHPSGHGIDDSRGGRWKSWEGVEFDRSCPSGQEEKSKNSGDQYQSRAAVF